ncbi:hypothetical protein AL025_15110 (plasmid) [Enterococcus faecium]|nr:hypothetical protein AL025_15110 [Enterococcus faecium]
MVVNDPKTELYVASKDELEARGYDVYAFNITDPLQSMSDNPLALIVKYWKRGDIDTATQLTNTSRIRFIMMPTLQTINTGSILFDVGG